MAASAKVTDQRLQELAELLADPHSSPGPMDIEDLQRAVLELQTIRVFVDGKDSVGFTGCTLPASGKAAA